MPADTFDYGKGYGDGLANANKTRFETLGIPGLQHYAGRIYEEVLPELRGYLFDKQIMAMTFNDPVIGAFLYAIQMLIRQTSWKIESDEGDEETTEFVRSSLFDDMENTWQDTLSEIVSFLPWGWSFLEKCFKRRSGESRDWNKTSKFSDGRIGWQKWSIRSQESRLRWEFDDAGDFFALTQLPPPDFRMRTIPMSKALLFRTTTRKSNPEGYSILRNAWFPYYYKTNISRIEAIGIERDLAGLPVAGIPSELFGASLTADQQAVFNAWKRIVTGIKRDEEEGVLYPLAYDDNGKPLFELKLLSTGGTRQFDTNAIVERYDQRILLTVMADFMLLGHSKGGTQALVRERTNIFGIALGAWLDSIASVINRFAIPELLKINGIDYKQPPKLVHGDVETIDLADLAAFVKDISQAGINIAGIPSAVEHILEQAKIPYPKESA